MIYSLATSMNIEKATSVISAINFEEFEKAWSPPPWGKAPYLIIIICIVYGNFDTANVMKPGIMGKLGGGVGGDSSGFRSTNCSVRVVCAVGISMCLVWGR